MKRRVTQTGTRLKVTGDADSIRRFLETVTLEDGDISIMNTNIPIEGPSTEQVETWGASFGDYSNRVVYQTDTEVIFEFWSYYDPLIKGLASISMLYPSLTFTGAYMTTIGFTLGSYIIRNGTIESFIQVSPETTPMMMKFRSNWDDKTQESWFDHAEEFVEEFVGLPISA